MGRGPDASARSPFFVAGAVEIIAHRGFSAEAPENTIVALEAGIEAGADAVEFDLHTAGDGTPVLLHDETLRRTTDGRGKVTDCSAEELAALDAGSWFDRRFVGEPVPTLADALEVVKRGGVRSYPEIKGARRPEDLDGVVTQVREAGLLGSTVFISMDWEALERMRAVEPDSLIGYIVEKRSRAESALARARGDSGALLDFDARILLRDPGWAELARSAGVPMATWTVDSVDDATTLLEMGVRRITTNQVRRLVRWKTALSSRG